MFWKRTENNTGIETKQLTRKEKGAICCNIVIPIFHMYARELRNGQPQRANKTSISHVASMADMNIAYSYATVNTIFLYSMNFHSYSSALFVPLLGKCHCIPL